MDVDVDLRPSYAGRVTQGSLIRIGWDYQVDHRFLLMFQTPKRFPSLLLLI